MTKLTLVHSGEIAKTLTTIDRLAAAAWSVTGPGDWTAATPLQKDRTRQMVRAMLLAYQEITADMDAAVAVFNTSEERMTFWRVGHNALVDYLLSLP